LSLRIEPDNRDGAKIKNGGEQVVIGSDNLLIASRTANSIQATPQLFFDGDDRRGQLQRGRRQNAR
jgi:hypothetical protein